MSAPDSIAALVDAASTQLELVTPDGAALEGEPVAAEVERLARQLRLAGFGPDHRIAIILENGPEMTLLLLAAMSVGCAAPLNPRYRDSEFDSYLEGLGASAMVAGASNQQAVRLAARHGLTLVEVHGSGFQVELDPPPISKRSTALPGGDDHALLLHTSGTTSAPKIVPLSQGQLVRSARALAAHLELDGSDRSLSVMPLFHVHGLVASLLAPVSSGASVICAPPFDAFRFHGWLADMQPTYYSAVPAMHRLVLARRDGPVSTTLRFIRSSSAPLPVRVLEGLRSMFDVPVVEAYGMTEAAHQIASNPLPPGAVKDGSVGLPTGVEVAVFDPESNARVEGERGELWVRGQTIIRRYDADPSADAAAFVDGWFRTGDSGFIDDDGYLFLDGRLKEQINRGGEKISPFEIEAAILQHPAVIEAIAFGYPSEKVGEEVGVAVVLASGEALDTVGLRSFLRERLAGFKIPPRVVFVDELPVGATGKVSRSDLASTMGFDGPTVEFPSV